MIDSGRTARARAHALAARSAVVLVALLCGCGLLSPKVPKVTLSDIHVIAHAAANSNSPVALEIVLVRDPDLLKKLTELPAAKWFETRADLRRTYPDAVESKAWELVPGQDLRVPAATFSGKRALAVLVFANYSSAGEHRARIDTFQNEVILNLLEKDFTVEPRS
jgi:type VI secretion system protein